MDNRVLVVYASKYGATAEIAEKIGQVLHHAGLRTDVLPTDRISDLTRYEAVVLGSAVYMGKWLDKAVEFVRRNRATLTDRPVWLFSSGPLGLRSGISSVNDPKLEPKEIAELREAIHPRDHRIFFGALDPSKLGFKHRAIRKLPAARAILPEGDFRDWEAINSWATAIADQLKEAVS